MVDILSVSQISEVASSFKSSSTTPPPTAYVGATNKSKKTDSNNNYSSSLLSINFFQVGIILYQIHHQQGEQKDENDDIQTSNVISQFHQLLTSLPARSIQLILSDIHSAFITLSQKFRSICSRNSLKGSGDDDNSVMLLEQVCQAIQSLCGIYYVTNITSSKKNDGSKNSNTTIYNRVKFDTMLVEEMANLYDIILDYKTTNDVSVRYSQEIRECILSTVSSLLLNGLIQSSTIRKMINNKSDDNDDAISLVMTVIQALSQPNMYCLGDLQEWQRERRLHSKHTTEIISLDDAISRVFVANDQKEYLLNMLSTAPKSLQDRQNANATASSSLDLESTSANSNVDTNNTTKVSALQRLIDKVHAVCPHLGKGYIEVALACYSMDADRTILTLLEGQDNPSSLHPRLRALDPSLPLRKPDSSVGNKDDEDEAKQIQKTRMHEMEQRQEKEAYLLEKAMTVGGGEYDDDYDDQYDGVGMGNDSCGRADGGLYDMDLNAIKAYNRAALDIEKEDSFWEENRNLNRSVKPKPAASGNATTASTGGHNDNNGDNDENEDQGQEAKKYRGPDKGKGGRIIGPDGKYLPIQRGRKKKQGGGGGGVNAEDPNRQPATSGKDQSNGDKEKKVPSTKIEKRRKNDNKSKIGNHHRKERALKKYSS